MRRGDENDEVQKERDASGQRVRARVASSTSIAHELLIRMD